MLNRRDFIKATLATSAGVVVSTGITACSDDVENISTAKPKKPVFKTGPLISGNVGFLHGVKSGDPLRDRAIIWTRITPLDSNGEEIDIHNDEDFDPYLHLNELPNPIQVIFEVAKDDKFANIVNRGEIEAKWEKDFTIKIDATHLEAGTKYFYRFISGGAYSLIGTFKTLPKFHSTPDQVKFVVFSCANYPNGYFNAYDAASKTGADVALHLGDYIYEYGSWENDDEAAGVPGYANKNAIKIGRQLPTNNNKECIKLSDYRRRYKLYATDEGSQNLHKAMPIIVIWDDHEVCNDSTKDSAENHNPDQGEGIYTERVQQALQAYYEWLPIRPQDPEMEDTDMPYPIDLDEARKIYRKFDFGNLLTLYMLETRLTARTKPGNGMLDVILSPNINAVVQANGRELLGADQRKWLERRVKSSNARWQVLGQQVVMGRMQIPVSTNLLYLGNQLGLDLTEINTYITEIKGSVLDDSIVLSQPTIDLFDNLLATLKHLTEVKADFKAGKNIPNLYERAGMNNPIPYNIDAWDGYYQERERLLELMSSKTDSDLVVLAGDTHNAWSSDLTLDDDRKTKVGVEFAGSSVSSPGMEEYLGYYAKKGQIPELENAILKLVENLKFCNLDSRGFMEVTFTPDYVENKWWFVDNYHSKSYNFKTDRNHTIRVNHGEKKIPHQDWETQWEQQIETAKGTN